MNQENTIGITIQARIADLLGTSELEQKLSESAKKVANIGTDFNQNIGGILQQPEFLSGLPEDAQKELEKIQRSMNAATKRMNERAQEQLNDYLEEEEIGGLTKAQVRKWQRKFTRVGGEENEYIENQLDPYITKFGDQLKPDQKEYLTTLRSAVKDGAEDISKNYKEMGEAIKGYHTQVNDAETATTSFFETVRKGGYFAAGTLAANQVMTNLTVGAEIEAKRMTAFDFSSPMAMYQTQKELQLFTDTKSRTLEYQNIGMLAGGIGGGLIGSLIPGLGTGLGILGGAALGRHFGEQIAGLENIRETGMTQAELKYLNQANSAIGQDVERTSNYEIPATQLSARFGTNLRNDNLDELGYTLEQRLAYKGNMGEALGKYNGDLFGQQLTFARAEGINPEDVFGLNRFTRFTGQNYDVAALQTGKQMTQKLFGEDADAKRIIDVLSAIKDLNMDMLRLNVNADSRQAMAFANLPEMLFGNTPFGQTSVLGGKTMNILQGLGKPNSQAAEAFLYQAYGTNDLIDINERMKGGIFSKDNLSRFMDYSINQYSGGNYEKMYWTLNSQLENMNVPAGFLSPLAHLFAGQNIQVPEYAKDKEGKYYYEDKEKNKYYKNGNDQFVDASGKVVKDENIIKELQQPTTMVTITPEGFKKKIDEWQTEHKTPEEITKLTGEMFGQAKKNVTDFEDTQTKMSRILIEIGESWKEKSLTWQLEMTQVQQRWVESAETQTKINNMMEKAFGSFEKYLNDQGIYTTKEQVNEAYNNKNYNAVFAETGYKVSDVLSDKQIEDLKKSGGDILGAYEKAALKKKYTEINWINGMVSGVNYDAMGVSEQRIHERQKAVNTERDVKIQQVESDNKKLYDVRQSIGGFNIGPYATDPHHEEAIKSIMKGLKFENAQDADKYIHNIAKGSPISGDMIFSAAKEYNVKPEIIAALMQQDSAFGTKGLGARTYNPGNVGNDDSGHIMNYGNWELGVYAIGDWLSKHRDIGMPQKSEREIMKETPTVQLPAKQTEKRVEQPKIFDRESLMRKVKENDENTEKMLKRHGIGMIEERQPAPDSQITETIGMLANTLREMKEGSLTEGGPIHLHFYNITDSTMRDLQNSKIVWG